MKLHPRDVAAYLLDRADQYQDHDPCWIALADAAKNILQGAVSEALQHGELDLSLYERLNQMDTNLGEIERPKPL